MSWDLIVIEFAAAGFVCIASLNCKVVRPMNIVKQDPLDLKQMTAFRWNVVKQLQRLASLSTAQV